MYELHLTNFKSSPLTIKRIEVLGVATGKMSAVDGKALEEILQPVGRAPESGVTTLAPGGSVIAFMSVSLSVTRPVPAQITHRVIFDGAVAEGALVGTHTTRLHVLGPPVEGAGWFAADGPGNETDNHHRRGIFIVDGAASISRRFATDWMGHENTDTVKGDPLDRRSYFAYGKNVLAVADAKVITALDGAPENIPGHNEKFHPAVPEALATISGNTITLDLGEGQYAHYMHLQPGSVRVKTGDRVRRGQLLGLVGASGDAREPHLHFEVTTSAGGMTGEGVPFVIDSYRVMGGGTVGPQTRALPLNNQVIDFGTRHAD